MVVRLYITTPNGLGTYCYAFLVLWPNGSYGVLPINPLAGSIEIQHVDDSVKVINTKLDVYGSPTVFPLRIRLNDNYIVFLAPHGVSYINITNGPIEVSKNIHMWYVYKTTETPPQETPPERDTYKNVAMVVLLSTLILVLLDVLRRLKRR